MPNEYVTREEFNQAIIVMNRRLDQTEQKIERKHTEQCDFVRESLEVMHEWHREEMHEHIGVMMEDVQHRIDVMTEHRRGD